MCTSATHRTPPPLTLSHLPNQTTPRLVKKFNYRIIWFDGFENHSLILDNYDHGPSAPYKSWVLLQKPAPAVEIDDE